MPEGVLTPIWSGLGPGSHGAQPAPHTASAALPPQGWTRSPGKRLPPCTLIPPCLVEIQVMMGSLVYLRLGLEKSPYCHLLDNSHWAEICETFTRDACSLLGLSVESPLSVRYSQPYGGSTNGRVEGNPIFQGPAASRDGAWCLHRPKLPVLVILPDRNYLSFYSWRNRFRKSCGLGSPQGQWQGQGSHFVRSRE